MKLARLTILTTTKNKAMKISNISPANYRQIMSLANSEPGGLHGSKLEAFYRFIQARGETIVNRAGVALYDGAKALKISETEYVGIQRVGFGRGFYPCKLKVLLMTEIEKSTN